MGLRKSIKKLDEYYGRLDEGKASKIKSSDVAKVIAKLTAKRNEIIQALASTPSAAKKERLTRKLLVAEEQLRRAEWLAQSMASKKVKA